MEISFTYPEYLLLLLAIPLFIFIHFFFLRGSKKKALRFANFDAISRVKGTDLFSKNLVILIISIIIVFLMVFSVSGLVLHKTAQTSSFSFVLAIDSSKSMEANDLSPNRLEAAKEIAKGFVENSPLGTRIGVISFSGNTYLEQKISNNKQKIKNSLESIGIDEIGGTDVYQSIITSINLLDNEDSRAIILISDGQANVGNINLALDYANKNNVLIHTIAVGTKQGGETSYGVSQSDTESLKSIAYNTDGSFFRARDKQEFESSLNEIMNYTEKKVSIDLSRYCLLAAIVFFILEYYLLNSRYRSLP